MKRQGVPKLLIVLLILAGLTSAGVYWINTWADPYWNAEHSKLRVEKTLDAQTLQSWAVNLLKQYSYETNFGGYYSVEEPHPSGLDDIWMHQPPSIILRDGRDGGERYVCLSWGSAMLGRWGLAIGSPKFVLKDGMESFGPPDLAPVEWKPGVYFFQHYH
jgi:hypothetical protein